MCAQTKMLAPHLYKVMPQSQMTLKAGRPAATSAERAMTADSGHGTLLVREQTNVPL